MLEAWGRSRSGLAGVAALFLLAMLAGCESIRIAGGTSEVGNPATALDGRDSSDASGSPVTGIGLSAHGMPIRILRESRDPEKKPDSASSLQDSLPTR